MLHFIVFAAGALLAAELTRHALRGGMLRTLLCVAGSVVPFFVLYMGFRSGGNSLMYVWPVYLLLTVAVGKVCLRLLQIRVNGVASVDNSADEREPHWAS